MLKKTITYTNPFTEKEVTEEHWFHISKAVLVEMDLEEHKAEYTNKAGEKLTGMQAHLSQISESEDGKAIMAAFKDLLRRSYGKREGDRFLQSDTIWEEFASTEAYSALFYEICTDPGKGAEFVNGIIPRDLAEEVAKLAVRAEAASTPAKESSPETRLLSAEEAREMDSDELASGLATGRYKLS